MEEIEKNMKTINAITGILLAFYVAIFFLGLMAYRDGQTRLDKANARLMEEVENTNEEIQKVKEILMEVNKL